MMLKAMLSKIQQQMSNNGNSISNSYSVIKQRRTRMWSSLDNWLISLLVKVTDYFEQIICK